MIVYGFIICIHWYCFENKTPPIGERISGITAENLHDIRNKHMDEAKNSTQGNLTDDQFALSKFLELFNSDGYFFKFYTQQISILEWFGRTVRGKEKIHDFLRYEVCTQYDHLNFRTAELCEPFECKSAELESKKINPHLNSTTIDSSFASDTTDLDVRALDTRPNRNCTDGSLTPPIPTKRLKYDKTTDYNQSFTPVLKIDDYFERKEKSSGTIPSNTKVCMRTPSSTTIESALCSTNDYSELRYFETSGILRSSTRPEHRSFRNSSTSNGNGSWDRKTRIKISYKIRFSDKDVQFYLISYQNVHKYSLLSRRNLMSEFEKVAPEQRHANSERSATIPVPVQPEVKRKMVRRLRLF